MTNSTLVVRRMALERGQGRGFQNYKQSSVIIRFNTHAVIWHVNIATFQSSFTIKNTDIYSDPHVKIPTSISIYATNGVSGRALSEKYFAMMI